MTAGAKLKVPAERERKVAEFTRWTDSTDWVTWLAPVVVLLVGCAFAFSITNQYAQFQIALFAFWVVVGMSWNLIGGYAGQLNLGQAAFIGLGAYSTAIVFAKLGVVPWFAMPVAAVIAGIVAAVLGVATLRLRGLYLGLASVALPFVLQIVFTYLGLQEIPIPYKATDQTLYMEWDSPAWYAVLYGFLALLTWYGTTLMERSKWRVVLQALRDDEDAAGSLGINTSKVKIAVFVISAAIAGIAGAIYTQMISVVSPDSVFNVNLSVQALLVCLVGGLARKGGPLVGSVVLVPLGAFLNIVWGNTSGASNLVYGAILIAFVIALPRGVIPPAGEAIERLTGRRRVPEAGRTASDRSELPDPETTHKEEMSSAGRSQEPLMVVSHIRKAYGGVVALDDISIQVSSGELVGIVGPNGAGKSTLFDLLTGYQRPTAGTITMFGNEVGRWAPYKIARLGVRRTFQTSRPFGELSVYDNIAAGALLRADPRIAVEEATRRALHRVRLEELATQSARSLVPAQLRLLEVARAIASDPQVLLLDEPLAGLDRAAVTNLMNLLKRLHQFGYTSVLVDHDIGTVAEHVTRLIVLDMGRVIASGAPDHVMAKPEVIHAYLGAGWQRAPA
jgi:ABC-type branched-subunit amino acid transport system ATPase component/ABC-type branched-subunit amino acid transport system permease subunit